MGTLSCLRQGATAVPVMASWALMVVCVLPVNHLPESTYFPCASNSTSNLDVSLPVGEFRSIFYDQKNQNKAKKSNSHNLRTSRGVKVPRGDILG